MKRAGSVLVVFALAPLLMGSGGAAPGVPGGFRIDKPRIDMLVVVDPHELEVTSTAKWATVRLHRGQKNASAIFRLPDDFALFFGCDLSLTDTRFLNVKLSRWIPPAVLEALFGAMGIEINDIDNAPFITHINVPVCTPDPANPGPLENLDASPSTPGMLSFEAVVQFLVPKGGGG